MKTVIYLKDLKSQELKTGDTVFLKSGGLLMKVTAIIEDNVECLWLNGRTGNFESICAFLAYA
ncbi:MAG: hypothetical protein LBK58_07400 [Prevotellaceae bacterium]|jgi:uncharacterized protein YodC (DUF2158 family)|nr:hypothetical protein [Prevotellaceae bacterium]